MRKLAVGLLVIFGLSLNSCEGDDGLSGYEISITRDGDKLTLINQTELRLYYFIMDELSLALWAPDVSDRQDKLAPRGQARLDLESITGYSESTKQLVLYYWVSTGAKGQERPGSVREIKFEL